MSNDNEIDNKSDRDIESLSSKHLRRVASEKMIENDLLDYN